MVEIIIYDVLEVTKYVPISIIVATILILPTILFKYKKSKKIDLKGTVIKYIFLIYLAAILEITLISRESGSRGSIDLVLFGTWGHTDYSKAFVVENIIMFIPYGLILPKILSIFNKFLPSVVIFLFSSVLLETVQLLTKRGYFQLDDIVMNIIGGVIGWAVFYTFNLIVSKLFDKNKI